MSYESKSRLHAASRVQGDGTVVGQHGIAAVVRNGPGDYTYTLEVPLGPGRRVVLGTIEGNETVAGLTMATQFLNPSEIQVNIETFNEIPAPTDAAHFLVVWALTGVGS